jgi:hypothetical protein
MVLERHTGGSRDAWSMCSMVTNYSNHFRDVDILVRPLQFHQLTLRFIHLNLKLC